MAILIKGIEMPNSCFLCRFCRRQEYGEYVGEDTAWSCVASKKRITDGQDLIATFKHPDCPLVEAAEVQDAVSRQAGRMRLIDPLELKRSISASVLCGDGKRIFEIIDEQPTIEPERKKGKWLPDNNNYIEERFVCSACGRSYKVDTCMGKPMWDFCPCGADMRGE